MSFSGGVPTAAIVPANLGRVGLAA